MKPKDQEEKVESYPGRCLTKEMAVSVMDGTATEPVKIDGRNIIVLYGSETGNAEEIAMELAGMTRRLHFKTTVDEMDNIKLVGSTPTHQPCWKS